MCPHNMVNFSAVTAEIDWWVWGTPTNFNGFHVLASLLQRRGSTEVNQTLHDVWPSPAPVHYIYIFGSSCPLTWILSHAILLHSLWVQVLCSLILAALLHGTAAAGVSQTLAAWYKEWNYGTFAAGATYIQLGGHDVGHRPTFSFFCLFLYCYFCCTFHIILRRVLYVQVKVKYGTLSCRALRWWITLDVS